MQSRAPRAEDTQAVLPSQDGASQPILPLGHPQAGRLLRLPRRRRLARRGGALPWQVLRPPRGPDERRSRAVPLHHHQGERARRHHQVDGGAQHRG
ncbi:hypothetical protein BHE74_00054695 [Ensete ventricosum]|nr:hypothetical protein GW17_00008260 [Ensete ventricosum]RWW39929.1 hypothetical protein BHE74_00054695 [Ensete ventricosum]